MNQNSFTGEIPALFGELEELKDLDLGSNGLSGTIPRSLCDLPKFKKFKAASNSLSGMIKCPLKTLEVLDLSNNELFGELPKSIGEYQNLTKLNLVNNTFSGTFPTEIALLTNLESLFIQGNQFEGTMPEHSATFTDAPPGFVFTDLKEEGESKNITAAAVAGSLSGLALGVVAIAVWECYQRQQDKVKTELDEDTQYKNVVETGENLDISAENWF